MLSKPQINKNPIYKHVQSKFKQTDKNVKKLRANKLEVHEKYKVKKILQNERCGNQFFKNDVNVNTVIKKTLSNLNVNEELNQNIAQSTDRYMK